MLLNVQIANDHEIDVITRFLRTNKPQTLRYSRPSSTGLFTATYRGGIQVTCQDQGRACFAKFRIGDDRFDTPSVPDGYREELEKLMKEAKKRKQIGVELSERLKQKPKPKPSLPVPPKKVPTQSPDKKVSIQNPNKSLGLFALLLGGILLGAFISYLIGTLILNII